MKYVLSLILGLVLMGAVWADPVDLKQVDADVTSIRQDLETVHPQSKEESAYVGQLGTIYSTLSTQKEELLQQTGALQKKIDALGTPAEGVAEAPEVVAQRAEFQAEQDKIKAEIAQADLILTRVDEINQFVASRRTQKIKERLFDRQEGIWHYEVFIKSVQNFIEFLKNVFVVQLGEYQALTLADKDVLENKGVRALYILGSSIVIMFVLGLFIKKKLGYRKDIPNPNYTQKVITAVSMLAVRGLIPSTVLGFSAWWIARNTHLFDGDFGVILQTAFWYMFYLLIALASVRVLFTPRNPAWRLLEVGNDRALKLCRALILSLILIFCFTFFRYVAMRLKSSSDIIFTLINIENVVKAFCILLVANRSLYNNKKLTAEELKKAEEEGILGLSLSSKISVCLTLATILVLGASLLGYIRLADFLLTRFILSVVFAGFFYIVRKLVLLVVKQILSLQFWKTLLRMSLKRRQKIEFWLNFFLSVLCTFMGGFFLLALWGVSVDIMLQEMKKLLTGFDIGGMHVSISSLIKGILAFYFSLVCVRLLRRSLVSGTLSHLDMDQNVRNSFVSVLGFFGFVGAVLVGISVMGGSLQGLAIVAGALSFGAGMGLQNVVNNFVSGLILLVERPIKIGDWVKVNGEEGIVKQISMRFTQIETFTKASVIIPNATILSSNVTNMTYQAKGARVDAVVGVAYDSDVQKVKDILLGIGADAPCLAKSPNPFVSFLELADSSLIFRLSVYITDVNQKSGVTTFLNTEIIQRFSKAGISIPFPQREVRILNDEEPKKKK